MNVLGGAEGAVVEHGRVKLRCAGGFGRSASGLWESSRASVRPA